jgi:tetratricopeptide (TPR) repeat protein
MSRKIFLALFTLFSAQQLAGAYDRSVLAEYNDLYKNGSYQAALEGYQEIEAKEPYNPYAFYNAGNTYFRMNKSGLAILNYAKAFRLDPRDPDIRANLEFALKHTGQAFMPEGMPKVLHYLYYFFSDLELRAAATVLWWLTCLMLSFYALKPGVQDKLRGFILGTVLVFFGSLLWLGARASSPFSEAAVITAEGTTPLMSGPGETFKTYATLPEARLVKVLDDADDIYYEIGIPAEGIKGWVKKTSAEKI